jgi:hypothetical protein
VERLHCPTCRNEVFFDSMQCVACGTALTYELQPAGRLVVGDAASGGTCMWREEWQCNWRPDPEAGTPALCPSCLIVYPGEQSINPLLAPFLAAQRRALWQLRELGVDWTIAPALRFAYRSSAAEQDVVIGHAGGTITLDLDEADPARGEHVRQTLGEPYRTPLGHIRHELGHYVWMRYVEPDPERLATFRSTFGDERADYAAALEAHYASVDDGSWRAHHVSHYASAHPWEDFAESWAQVMHIHDVVSTGVAWGVIPPPIAPFDPAAWVSAAVTASIAANELSRSMGMADLYPFALSSGARQRIETCWLLVRPPGGPAPETQAPRSLPLGLP